MRKTDEELASTSAFPQPHQDGFQDVSLTSSTQSGEVLPSMSLVPQEISTRTAELHSQEMGWQDDIDFIENWTGQPFHNNYNNLL